MDNLSERGTGIVERLPGIAPGHWDTPDGLEMAMRCAAEDRGDLTKGDISDFALANAVFMASRGDLELIVYQTAAKERIRWLSTQLALSAAHIEAQAVEIATLKAEMERRDRNELQNCVNWGPCSRNDDRMTEAALGAKP